MEKDGTKLTPEIITKELTSLYESMPSMFDKKYIEEMQERRERLSKEFIEIMLKRKLPDEKINSPGLQNSKD